ncbi:MAG: hypothetical protein IT508_12965, partial [Burkholderiaceae bacterium]|nr:hypothetical protein [Burkholderiaceae bacterium]
MRSRDFGLWDYLYLFLLALAVPVGIFHLVQGRYGQAVIAAGAVAIGLAFLWFVRPEVMVTEEVPAQGERPTVAAPVSRDQERHADPRKPDGRMRDWLSRSVVSGFTATSVMTVVIIIGYTFVRAAGDIGSGDSTIQGWLRALGDNTLTESATLNLPLVLLIHFTAGIVWALIYGAMAEPRLSGPGLRRGMIFSLIPWLVSLVVFLPLTGAGFLGLDLDAG